MGSEKSWPNADVSMTEISMEVVAWRWSMLTWLDCWHVVELFVVILSVGFALGYVYAKYKMRSKGASYDGPERLLPIPSAPPIPRAPLRCEFCTDRVNPQIFPYPRCTSCGAAPSYHHGRCCPLKKAEDKGVQGAANAGPVPGSTKEGVKKEDESLCLCRTIATQSQCTYKRNLLTPRFHVLPELAGGVSDISYEMQCV